ncbi:hypothetical protein HHL17_25910 [Chitinophaga sp. G-6-1-13]|uniref:Uncharacterized protein n=1 Tax=Chitinophaga fulva TaxID=2728842 RepID=A0A848GTI3_9BACT|nr:hypothetical protein [Chitinophaga fulva]NML40659.1 hypothetical protein [Chitinophaga fulva]
MHHQDISEKYRKFLLEVRLSGKVYYTVHGADTSDASYDDKWLTDTDDNILLFSSPDDLYAEILRMDETFDKTQMQTWAVARLGSNEPYAMVDLDLLEKPGLHPDTDLLATIYLTLQLLKDYAIQADDQQLLMLFEGNVIERFIDFIADYAVWGKKIPEKLTIDTKTLFPVLKALYARLLEKIKIS